MQQNIINALTLISESLELVKRSLREKQHILDILDKHPEVQAMKTNALIKSGLDEESISQKREIVIQNLTDTGSESKILALIKNMLDEKEIELQRKNLFRDLQNKRTSTMNRKQLQSLIANHNNMVVNNHSLAIDGTPIHMIETTMISTMNKFCKIYNLNGLSEAEMIFDAKNDFQNIRFVENVIEELGFRIKKETINTCETM